MTRDAPTVLVAGEFSFDIYEPSFCRGLSAAGARVVQVRTRSLMGPGRLAYRAQSKLVFGPGIVAARAALIAACARHRPDVVLAWRSPWLDARTIRLARLVGARRVTVYNNDDPFGPDRDLRIWRCYRRSLAAADCVYVYRRVNVEEARASGARRVSILRSYFLPEEHRPLPADDPALERVRSDVAFVGHFEDDGRAESVAALVRAGLRVRLFGTDWEAARGHEDLRALFPVERIMGDDYVRAIQAARVALVFLSTRNRDGYTRRCFEIPAIGTAMLAPRTPELGELYSDGDEVALYGSREELVKRARELVRDDALRDRIARGGRDRCWRDGYDVRTVAARWLDDALQIPVGR